MVSIFHDHPIVNRSVIIVLLGQVWVYARKKECFRRGKRENEFERKRERRDVS